MISDERRSINRENPNSSSIPVGTRCRPRFWERLSHAEDHSDRGKDEEHDVSSVRFVDRGPDYKTRRQGTKPTSVLDEVRSTQPSPRTGRSTPLQRTSPVPGPIGETRAARLRRSGSPSNSPT